MFASHGTYRDTDRNLGSTMVGHGLQMDWVLNDKFEADPKKYLVRNIPYFAQESLGSLDRSLKVKILFVAQKLHQLFIRYLTN